MILGLLSDSHGRADRVRQALALLDERGAQTFIHCGDIGGVDVFEEFVGRDLRFVWGNCDVPTQAVNAYLQTVGLTAPAASPLELTLAGRTIQVFHGHEPQFRTALAHPNTDYILHGHTHAARDERVSRTRIINPGALQRAAAYTVATLNLADDVLEFHELR
ncbi:MAG TPA: metallophosphoesterase family protein [Phycisphaerae bacterium]|nr:metallophosphoesterase family protein [Phycisphaerales bacterium]HRX86443.1 metallophosphoesterase family protein [Phycisphaerae bacterium]